MGLVSFLRMSILTTWFEIGIRPLLKTEIPEVSDRCYTVLSKKLFSLFVRKRCFDNLSHSIEKLRPHLNCGDDNS